MEGARRKKTNLFTHEYKNTLRIDDRKEAHDPKVGKKRGKIDVTALSQKGWPN